MDGGQVVVVDHGTEEDLDSFFRDKDRRKQERLAMKKAKAKADREQMPPPSAWMTTDEAEQAQLEQFEGAGTGAPPTAGDQQVQQDEATSEELAARLQQQAAVIYRPEDDEWIDPEREFAPVPGVGGKKKHHNRSNVAQQEDKLLLLVAPDASKLQDLSVATERAAKAKAALTSGTTAKGWSKVSAVEAEPIPAAEPAQKPQETTPKEDEAPKKVETPQQEEAPSGAYVIRAKRTEGAAPTSPAPGRSPRTQSPASKPAPGPEPGAYIPPALRRQQQPAQPQQQSGPLRDGPSRPAGSGLAAVSQIQKQQQAAKKVMPDLKSADEFPSLG